MPLRRLQLLLGLLLATLVTAGCTPGRGGGGGSDGDDDDSAGDDDDAADDDDLFNPDDDDDSQNDDDDGTPFPDDDDNVEDDDDFVQDDDDSFFDDDDSFGDDDDSFGDDDDVTPPPTTACTGSADFHNEQEPNDDPDAGDVHALGDSTASEITIEGSFSSCANDGQTWTGDQDYFIVNMQCTGDLTAELTWTGASTDADFNVFAPAVSTTELALAGYTFDTNPPELETATDVGGELTIGVLCWEGAGGDWTMTLTFN